MIIIISYQSQLNASSVKRWTSKTWRDDNDERNKIFINIVALFWASWDKRSSPKQIKSNLKKYFLYKKNSWIPLTIISLCVNLCKPWITCVGDKFDFK